MQVSLQDLQKYCTLNKNNNSILTVIDTFSKKNQAFAIGKKTRNFITQTLKKFKIDFQKNKYTDERFEFVNKSILPLRQT